MFNIVDRLHILLYIPLRSEIKTIMLNYEKLNAIIINWYMGKQALVLYVDGEEGRAGR